MRPRGKQREGRAEPCGGGETPGRVETRGDAETPRGEERAGRGGASPRRRVALIAAAAIAACLALVAACGRDEAAAPATPGSTLRSTLIDADGDGFLEPGPGEPLIDRGGHARPGATLATFAQLTDTHIRDEESPARVPFLDRLGGRFTSTFRPQEAFSTQTLDAAVRAVNREKPQAVFVTGDIVDNAQQNELDMAIETLNGRTVHPDSGAKGYDGVQDPDSADPFYYRPDHDAPEHPGALDEAQKPFKAAGLNAPWYPLPGNHDLLAQGEVPPTTAIQTYATGNRLVSALDPRIQVPTEEQDAKQAVANVLSGYIPLPSQRVPSDPHRRLLTPPEVEATLIRAAAHGTSATSDGLMDYAVDVGSHLKAVTLDTVRRDGTSQGQVTPAQVAWLKTQLATDRYVIVLSHNPLDASEGGAAALAALDQDPRVVAAISGNRHKNVISRHRRFWLIGTSSLADFPQQARMFRLRKTPSGVALETWMVDHDGRGLAGVSRELAYLDAQGGRPQRFAGKPTDRNVRLYPG
jgi:3',5'-cyclic AMP phosphodiesterase CpdA